MHETLERQLREAGVAEGAGAPTPEAWRAILDDVSRTYAEGDRDRQTLARFLAISRATHEASPDGILVVDENRRVVGFNQRFVDMWGIPETVIATRDGTRFLDHVLPRLAKPDAFAERVLYLYSHPMNKGHEEIALDDGRVFDRYTAPVVSTHGTTYGRVWFFRDVTEIKRSETEAREASRAKSEFLSNMSHELRTPLNAILGFGRVLEGGAHGPLTDRQMRHLKNMVRAAEHMLALINDLLDLRRLEADRDSLTLEMTPLHPLVEEAVAMVRPLVDERFHRLTVSLPEDLPLVVVDRRSVVQILVNLLSNAAKYTEPRGNIDLRVGEAPSGLAVAVEIVDTGIGIKPEDQPRLFNYFERLGAKHAHNMKGSGIGLALTRHLVEKLGGEIGVSSVPGEGSTFRFTLPAHLASAEGVA